MIGYLLLGLGAAAYFWGRRSATSHPPKEEKVISTGYLPSSAPLSSRALYRVTVRVPMSHVDKVRSSYGEYGQKALIKDIRTRLEQKGFEPILLVTQDPTDNTLFSVLARYPSSNALSNDSIITIQSLEPVDEPAPVQLSRTPFASQFPLPDSGMTADEMEAWAHAMLYERNPRHLNGIASTFEPWFPVASTLLAAKAKLIESRVEMTPNKSARLMRAVLRKTPLHESVEARKRNFEAFAQTSEMPYAVLKDEVKRAALTLTEEPRSSLQGYPDDVINLARVMVEPIERFGQTQRSNASSVLNNIWVINPSVLYTVFPPEASDGFVSPSAMQLALAAQKPQTSGVQSSDKLADIYSSFDMSEAKNAEERRTLYKARHQMERATRAIERRRWIEWYRRTHQRRS